MPMNCYKNATVRLLSSSTGSITEFIVAGKVAELDLGKIDVAGKGILASFETTLNRVQIGRAAPSTHLPTLMLRVNPFSPD